MSRLLVPGLEKQKLDTFFLYWNMSYIHCSNVDWTATLQGFQVWRLPLRLHSEIQGKRSGKNIVSYNDNLL